MSNVKQDNFFSLILFVPKNENNGLHPSESSDIRNTQNWFFQFCFFFSTSGLVNELMASWGFDVAGEPPWNWQKCQQQSSGSGTRLCSCLCKSLQHSENFAAARFSDLFFCSWTLPTALSIILRAQKTQYFGFFLEESVAGGAVEAPTAHRTHPSFQRTVRQPDWVKHSSESASGTVDTRHYLKAENVHFLHQWQKIGQRTVADFNRSRTGCSLKGICSRWPVWAGDLLFLLL